MLIHWIYLGNVPGKRPVPLSCRQLKAWFEGDIREAPLVSLRATYILKVYGVFVFASPSCSRFDVFGCAPLPVRGLMYFIVHHYAFEV